MARVEPLALRCERLHLARRGDASPPARPNPTKIVRNHGAYTSRIFELPRGVTLFHKFIAIVLRFLFGGFHAKSGDCLRTGISSG